jgi:hypothetical protein
LVITLAAVGAAGFYFWSIAGRASLQVGDADIANAPEILAAAEQLVAEAAAADGAPLDADARCHFAPGSRADIPAVLCGPLWLGVSPLEEPWVEVFTSYTTIEEQATGQVEEIVGTTTGERQNFIRPDGQSAAEPASPPPLTSGIRLFNGALLLNPDAVLVGAEEALVAAVAEATADGEDTVVLADDWGCYFRQGPEEVRGLLAVETGAYCGPARDVRSNPESIWVPVGIRLQSGPTFGTVAFEAANANSLRPREVPEGASLILADGSVLSSVDADSVDRPPVPVDFIAITDFALPVQPAASGLLITERSRVEFSAIDRVKQIGSGARSFTAPDGHDLVVASVPPQEDNISVRGVVSIDGNDVPLPRVPSVAEGATIVVVVPEDATAVDLIAENNGRPQSISLIDGTLADGFPLALYRPTVESPLVFGSRVEMPAGEAVLVNGTVSVVDWLAKDEEREWLQEGVSHLVLEFEDWNVDRPCCDVDIESVLATFTLVDKTSNPDTGDSDTENTDTENPDAENADSEPASQETVYTDRREDPTGRPTSRSPRFEVPEDLAAVTARMEVTVLLTQDDGEPQTITDVVEVEIVLP